MVLAQRKFDHTIPPPPLKAVFRLAGEVIATPGNLVAIAAAVKAGKSAVVSAMCASTLTVSGEADLLGFTLRQPSRASRGVD